MANDWRLTTLDQLGRIVTGKTPPSTVVDAFGGSMPFVTPSDMNGERLISSTSRKLSASGQAAVKNCVISKQSVLVSCIGSDMGKAAIANFDCVTNQQINSIIVDAENSPLFVYYNLSLRKAEIRGSASGSAQPILNKSAFGRLQIHLPPITEQRAIAHVLSKLDEKIELNRHMNETLKAMVCTLFKAWFVDFEPVRAKMEGRWQRGQSLPGLPAHLYDFFPNLLVESEFGEIPEGWEEGSFGRIVSQRSERVGRREITVLSAVASGKLVRSDEYFNKRVYSKETDKYLLVEQWDFAYNPSRINIGSIGMLEEDIVGGVSPVYVVGRPKTSYQWFLEFSIQRPHIKTWINILASGSVRQSLSYTDFASIPCVIPPEAVVQEFNRRWSTLREGIRSREAESRSLAQLRDTLLPKLISGELRVPDAERFVRALV